MGRFINADSYAQTYETPNGANMFAYCLNNPILCADKDGEAAHIVIGAIMGAAFEIGSQLIASQGDVSSLNFKKIGIAAAVGGITAACGPISGALISGFGNAAIELSGGDTTLDKVGVSFLVGVGASFVGYGAGKLATKIGGSAAIKNLAKESPGQIKRAVTSVIDVAGVDRNAIKNLDWAVKQYPHLPSAVLGKNIPQFFNSLAVGISGYGTMGGIYGFT